MRVELCAVRLNEPVERALFTTQGGVQSIVLSSEGLRRNNSHEIMTGTKSSIHRSLADGSVHPPRSNAQEMDSYPVVHLELHTPDPQRARVSFERLFGWRSEQIHLGTGTYLALDAGEGIELGIVEQEVGAPSWLPYVETADIAVLARRARALGWTVLLEPREGLAGWRSILRVPAGGDVALWQPKL
jgi:predicted enzyme related to lactoylglutathione lyase